MKNKGRRPYSGLPHLDLNSSILLARGVLREKNSAPPHEFAEFLNQESFNSGTRLRIAGTRHFGLTTTAMNLVKITPLGRALIENDADIEKLQTAFLNPPLFLTAAAHFVDTPVPIDNAALEEYLIQIGVRPSMVSRARYVFLKSAQQAGLMKARGDKLAFVGEAAGLLDLAPDRQFNPAKIEARKKSTQYFDATLSMFPGTENVSIDRYYEWLRLVVDGINFQIAEDDNRRIQVTISRPAAPES